jgi:hypothetical protein
LQQRVQRVEELAVGALDAADIGAGIEPPVARGAHQRVAPL